MKAKKIGLICSTLFLLATGFTITCSPVSAAKSFDVQSVDTMKFSRDAARALLNNPSLKKEYQAQVASIARVGATHVAIGTPYDEEFLPALKQWVSWAREYGLNVWFRGNWSGWEKWFNYSNISPRQHLEKTKKFLIDHIDLFNTGDIFTPCPECENGGPGDPRMTGKIQEFKNFLISHQRQCEEIFQPGPQIKCGYHSMNGDVAKLIMDKDTTALLGGTVVVDHYVSDPRELDLYANEITKISGGKVIFGEFGAPIVSIHGKMTEWQQAMWIKTALELLKDNPNVHGVNYWTSFGGSTALWNPDGSARLAVEVLREFFSPPAIEIEIKNEIGAAVPSATVVSGKLQQSSDLFGKVSLAKHHGQATIYHPDYLTKEINLSQLNGGRNRAVVEVERKDPSFLYQIQKLLKKYLRRLTGLP